MKFSKLLVLSALWLTAGSAMATIEDGVRQAPAPESTAFVTGSAEDYYYLYNTSASMFFTEGNTWGTRGCVGPYASAVKMYFSEVNEGTYHLNNYVCIRNTNYSWLKACGEGAGNSIYTDQSASGTWRGEWIVVPTSGNGFRLQTTTTLMEEGDYFMGRDDEVAQDFGNAYSGFKDDSQRFPLSAELLEGAGHHIDWILVTPAAYAAVADLWPLYEKSKELKAAIDEAEEKSINVKDETAVYENEASTIDQMDAAIASIKDKLIKAAEDTATPDNPSDMTSAITNASYDTGTTGWSGTTPAIGYTAGEFYEKNYNMYQDLTGIPNGVYAVKVKGFFRPGSTADSYTKWATGKDLNAYLYAKAGEDSVAVALVNIYEGSTDQKLGVGTEYGPDGTNADGQSNYVPNNMQAGEAYFEAGRYQNFVLNAVDDGKLRIGLSKDDSNFGMNWTMFDQWELIYLGNSAAAFEYWLNEMKKTLPDYSEMGETIFTEDYLTAYNTVVSNATATNKAEAVAAIKAMNDANDALKNNIALWEELKAVIATAIEVGADATLDETYTAPLADWAEFDTEEILNAHELSNEELEALITEKKGAIDDAKKHPTGDRDMTDLLVNADFEKGEQGWTGFNSARRVKYGDAPMPVTGGTATNKCAEAFSTTEFDLYQIVNNAPVGVYEISVQGFCRNGRGDIAWNNYQNQTEYSQPGKFPVYVYLNAKTTPFVNVFSEPVEEGYYKGKDSGSEVYVKDGVEFPDGMVSSAVAFADGMYKQAAYGLVAKEGDSLRIGVKGKSYGLNGEDDNWVIFDNFKLTWKGYQADVVQPVLEDEITKATALKEENMGKTVFAALETKLAAAEASLGGEGKVMFNCLSDLFDVEGEVAASKELFRPLEAAMTKLEKEMEGREGHSKYSEAETLFNTNTEKMANHEIEDADIENMVNEINSMISKLRMPDGTEDASDDNVIDMTDLIENAEFDEGVDGWKGTTATWGDTQGALAEFHNKNFDFYQDLAGLPAGTYTVTVQAFYRAGDGVTDYKNYFTVDSVRRDNAILYAKAFKGGIEDEDTVFLASAVKRLASIIAEDGYEYKDYDSESVDGYAKVKTDTISYPGEDDTYMYTFLPNTMTTANDAFLNDYFTENSVTIKIEEGQILRVGLMKENLIAQDWTIFDNWQLWYNGTASQKEQSDQATGVKDLSLNEKVTVEYFTLDGRKASRLQKGIMIQKVIFSNGATVVRKVRR